MILGHVAQLQCRVSSDESVPYEIDWFHEGRLIDAEISHRISLDRDGTLKIAEARASDAGEYSCKVTKKASLFLYSKCLKCVIFP